MKRVGARHIRQLNLALTDGAGEMKPGTVARLDDFTNDLYEDFINEYGEVEEVDGNFYAKAASLTRMICAEELFTIDNDLTAYYAGAAVLMGYGVRLAEVEEAEAEDFSRQLVKSMDNIDAAVWYLQRALPPDQTTDG